MRNSIWPVLLLVIVAGVAGIAFYLHRQGPATPATAPAAPATAPPAGAAEAQPHYPIAEAPAAAATPPPVPLPALEDSDTALQNALSGLTGWQSLEQFLELKGLIRRIVATVDNLPRDRVSRRLMAVKPVPGRFAVGGNGESLGINPDNAARYAPYVRFAQALDAHRLVQVYVHFYPLFQQAYVDLGYPDGYFNDRLVTVIDHLLATPAAAGPLRLTQPNVLYLYADPQLESLSAGQKILLRMGSANAAAMKDKLRQIRVELVQHAPPR